VLLRNRVDGFISIFLILKQVPDILPGLKLLSARVSWSKKRRGSILIRIVNTSRVRVVLQSVLLWYQVLCIQVRRKEMAYTANAGDTIEVKCENEDGNIRTLVGTVEYNTTRDDPDNVMGSPKMKLHTSKKRVGTDILMYPDGTMRVKPRFNSNGAGQDCFLKDMTMVEEAS